MRQTGSIVHKFTPTLRFKRWSRKAYAAFVSRHHVVTIGQLDGSVCERLSSKTKQQNVCLLDRKSINYNEECEKEDDQLQTVFSNWLAPSELNIVVYTTVTIAQSNKERARVVFS